MGRFLDTDEYTLDLSNAEARIAETKTFQLERTRFDFLNDHFGLRRGNLHVLGASTGTGKTTVVRAVLSDVSKTRRVVMLGTEEEKDTTELAYIKAGKNSDDVQNIRFSKEEKLTEGVDSRDVAEWARRVTLLLLHTKAEALFYDNITTSRFYPDKDGGQQGAMVEALQRIARDCNIPVFVVVHLHPIPDHEIVSVKHVRGGKAITLKADYLYLMNSMMLPSSGDLGADTRQSYIIVEKDRHGNNQKALYFFTYDFESREMTRDSKKAYPKLMELHKKRVKLGR